MGDQGAPTRPGARTATLKDQYSEGPWRRHAPGATDTIGASGPEGETAPSVSYVSKTPGFAPPLKRSPPSDPAQRPAAVSQAILDEQPIEPSPAPETAFSAALGPACEKCGRPNGLAACPHCGWYPVLGIHVEIDDAYEAAMNGTQAIAEVVPEAVEAG